MKRIAIDQSTVMALRDRGLSFRAIADQVGCSMYTIQNRIAEYEITGDPSPDTPEKTPPRKCTRPGCRKRTGKGLTRLCQTCFSRGERDPFGFTGRNMV